MERDSTIIVPFKVNTDDKRLLEEAARTLDTTTSDLIRDALAHYMKRKGVTPITGQLRKRGGDRRSARAKSA